MKKSRFLIVTAIAALFAAPAFAQDRGDDYTATLRVDIGSAMASTGGEFTTAPSGTRLVAGDRVMLAEGNEVTLVYENGCDQKLKEAGVYTVSSTCVAALPLAGAGADLGGAGIISGIAVGGAAILESMDDRDYVPPPPVSR